MVNTTWHGNGARRAHGLALDAPWRAAANRGGPQSSGRLTSHNNINNNVHAQRHTKRATPPAVTHWLSFPRQLPCSRRPGRGGGAQGAKRQLFTCELLIEQYIRTEEEAHCLSKAAAKLGMAQGAISSLFHPGRGPSSPPSTHKNDVVGQHNEEGELLGAPPSLSRVARPFRLKKGGKGPCLRLRRSSRLACTLHQHSRKPCSRSNRCSVCKTDGASVAHPTSSRPLVFSLSESLAP